MKLSLVTTLKNRTASTSKDGKMQNAFAEIKNGIARAVKRPSLNSAFAALEGGSGAGQGLFSFSTPEGVQTLVGIQNDVLNNSPTSTATRLRFTTQPVDWKIDTAMSPSVVVKAYDSFGNIKTSFTGDVTISFYDNPNGGTLSGTLTVTAVSGVATFSNLKIDKVGGGYSFVATSPFMKFATSSTFKIISNLSFTIQPNSAAPNDPIVCTVSAVDASSGVITGYTGNITIAIGNNPSGGALSGTLTAPAVAGVASFADLTIDQLGNSYTLVASETSGGMPDVTSNAFDITNSWSLTAAQDGAVFGFLQDNFGPGMDLGAISPTTFHGCTINQLTSKTSATTNTIFRVVGTLPQSAFTSMTANSVTLTSASASFTQGGGFTRWSWTGSVMFSSAASYPVTFT